MLVNPIPLPQLLLLITQFDPEVLGEDIKVNIHLYLLISSCLVHKGDGANIHADR